MKFRYLMSALLGIAALLCLSTGEVLAQTTEHCTITAKNAAKGCRADVDEEYWIGLGNCQNLASYAERGDCRAEVELIQEEDTEECTAIRDARYDACDLLGQDRVSDPLEDPNINFVDPDGIPDVWPVNPYVSLAVGHTYVLQAGEDFEETVVVTVTDEIREINGVDCRVVVDAVVIAEEDDEEPGTISYEPEEITEDYFAQSETGDVYYCGETSENYEDGHLTDLDGSFISGVEFAKAGLLMRVAPQVGDADRQEWFLDEAEDISEYVDLAGIPSDDEGGENENFPCAPGGCLKTFETAPIDPEDTEFKYYISGVGFVLATAMEDGEFTGEREELLCVGDSLDVLNDETCGIEDVEELLDELCELAPDAFCPPDPEDLP
ncbi:MAG: hypothetical protein ACR2QU_09670 [Gammaproteobacteria bacterium]